MIDLKSRPAFFGNLKIRKEIRTGIGKIRSGFFGIVFAGTVILAGTMTGKTASAQGSGVVDNWTGPYLGLTVGVNSSNTYIDDDASNDLKLDDSGVSAGVVGGYNFAPFGQSDSGQWLVGLEADLQNLDSNDRKSNASLGAAKQESIWLASTRVRAGYAWENVHLYGTAGLAYSDLQVQTVNDKGDDFSVGLALGLGAEMVLTENWTGRLEGMVYGFGEEDRKINNSDHDIGMGVSVVRLGVTRRF